MISFIVKHKENNKVYSIDYKNQKSAERYKNKLIKLGYESWIEEEEFNIPEFIVKNLTEEQKKLFGI